LIYNKLLDTLYLFLSKSHKKMSLKRMGIWTLVVAAILAIPLIGNAPWTLGDYIFASVILLGGATAYESATAGMNDKKMRMLTASLVLIIVIGIWALAVAD